MSHNPNHYFLVRNWRNYQHYSKRNPPWIKLHYELLASEDWAALDDASRVLAVACMLIASRHDGRVPKDARYVQRVAYLSQPPDFAPLVRCGFLTDFSPIVEDASALLATCVQDASLSVSASVSNNNLSKKQDEISVLEEAEDSVPGRTAVPSGEAQGKRDESKPNGTANLTNFTPSAALLNTRLMRH